MHINIQGVAAARRRLSQLGSRMPLVLRRVLNKTMRNEKVYVARKIREEVNLKASFVKKHIKINRARLHTPLASVVIRGKKKIGIEHFGARQTQKGVSVKIRKNKPRDLIQRAFYLKNDAFPPQGGRMRGSAFYKRKDRAGRLPVKRLYGPLLPNVVGENQILLGDVLQYGLRRLEINTDAELNYELMRNA